MALDDNALVSTEEVKLFANNIEKNNSFDDDLLEILINSVTDQFESYCGVDSFKAQDYTEVLSSIGCNSIFVKNLPVNTVDSIYIDGDWVWDDSTLIDSSDYRISNGRFILLKRYLNRGDDNLKVVYNGGYETIPGDLKLACIKEVVHHFNHRNDFDVISTSLTDGSQSVIENVGLLKSTKQIINKYKRVLVP